MPEFYEGSVNDCILVMRPNLFYSPVDRRKKGMFEAIAKSIFTDSVRMFMY